MIQQQLPAFLNVVASGIAQLTIPLYTMTLQKVVLALGGTAFTKAMITDIKVKIGTRLIYNISGTNLDKINKYKGIFDHAGFLTIDFTERDAPSILGKEVGGIDMSKLGGRQLTVEVTIAGATAPTLSASAWMTPPQENDVIHKLLLIPASVSVGGKFMVPVGDLKGALIKRAHFMYNGTDWGASTNGNLNRLEVKKNGIVVWDMPCVEARFAQQEFRKVPQSKVYVFDPGLDNNTSGYLTTADAAALEFNTYLTAADGMSVYLELLDTPDNV